MTIYKNCPLCENASVISSNHKCSEYYEKIEELKERITGLSFLDRNFNVQRITQIKVSKTDKSAQIPKYAHSGDSGFDLASTESVTLSPGETKLVSTGLSFQIPRGYEMQVRPRSGLSLKSNFRVANSPGTIDSNYRGEVKIIAENTGHRPIFIEKGDRIAQGVICPVYNAIFIEDELEDTERGSLGFGSSGVK